jgi:sucrose phosphorylase
MPVSAPARDRVLERLQFLYGDGATDILERIDKLVAQRPIDRQTDQSAPLWDEKTIILITYGDQVRNGDTPALVTLLDFLSAHSLQDVLDSVHLLPIFPYSSDDGFSVIDYRQIRPDLGSWQDVSQLGAFFNLALDFVLNHCSRKNDWFEGYLRGESPYDTFFIEVDPAVDLSMVTRPRTNPLLTPVETSRGTRHVWTTFSADQIDLNLASPDLLLEVLDILLLYVQHGARIIRLDAIGFLWKQIGTSCMHLPQTHQIVKLMRDLLDEVAPGTILLTETNVPHKENISYFGDGDEARAVYQFSLAPLLLDAYLTEDATSLHDWLAELEYPGSGMTFFNFTASHDGIGVRPLEGLVPQERFDALVTSVPQRGGLVSWRETADGAKSPYELNIAYFSALDSPAGLSAELHVRKFLSSQALVLALRGIPGVYFHSLVGTENDTEGVARTGKNRSINRRKFDAKELNDRLESTDSKQRAVFEGYRRLLGIRRLQPAFHPDGPQRMIDTADPSVIGFERTSPDGEQSLLVLANMSGRCVSVALPESCTRSGQSNLLSTKSVVDGQILLDAFEIAWLV